MIKNKLTALQPEVVSIKISVISAIRDIVCSGSVETYEMTEIS